MNFTDSQIFKISLKFKNSRNFPFIFYGNLWFWEIFMKFDDFRRFMMRYPYFGEIRHFSTILAGSSHFLYFSIRPMIWKNIFGCVHVYWHLISRYKTWHFAWILQAIWHESSNLTSYFSSSQANVLLILSLCKGIITRLEYF
jgi:hypothetical protein